MSKQLAPQTRDRALRRDRFSRLLSVLPSMQRCSYQAVVAAVQDMIREELSERDSAVRLRLSSGIDIVLTHGDRDSIVIDITPLPKAEYPALRSIAEARARRDHVSLESYYFTDTSSAMFGFNTLPDDQQVETLF